MPFIDVEAATQRDDFSVRQSADDHSAFVTGDRRFRKSRNVPKGNSGSVIDETCKSAKPGAKDDCEIRIACGCALRDRARGYTSCLRGILRRHASDPTISSILSETSSISI